MWSLGQPPRLEWGLGGVGVGRQSTVCPGQRTWRATHSSNTDESRPGWCRARTPSWPTGSLFFSCFNLCCFFFLNTYCHFKSGMKQFSPQACIFPLSVLPQLLFISLPVSQWLPFRQWHQRCCYRCCLSLVSFALERILVGSNAPVETQAELSSFSIILF